MKSLKNIWNGFWRRIRNKMPHQPIINQDISVICNNCLGAMVLHDLGMKFNTPTVNLFILPKDYLHFLEDLENNLTKDFTDITHGSAYPIGLLDQRIPVHFLHYKTFSEAVQTWKRRARRVKMDHLFLIMVERDGCTYEDLKAFDRLPYPNKMAVVHKEYPDIKSAVVVPYYRNDNEVGTIFDFKGLFGKKYYDCIDWISFFNRPYQKH